MNAVVYNACYGGFNLSLKAVNWLEQNAKDETLCKYIKEHLSNIKQLNVTTLSSKDDLICYAVSDYFRDKRHHTDLVAVVEALGDDADGDCSKLCIVHISGNQYRIESYDGAEDVITPEESDWIFIED